VQRIIAGDGLLGCGKAGGCKCRSVIGRRATDHDQPPDLGADVVT
jgi:hypothetical protein